MNFSPRYASEFGLPEAVMLHNLIFWIRKNQKNKINLHKTIYKGQVLDRTFTYNSVANFAKIFPFWSTDQIKRILKNMRENEIILVDNFNKKKYDKTNWYALVDTNLLDESNTKNYTFSPQLAIQYGLQEAVLLQNIIFSIKEFKKKGINEYYLNADESVTRTFVENSVGDFSRTLYFWSDRQIEKIIKNLVKNNVLIAQRFNFKNSYALCDEENLLNISNTQIAPGNTQIAPGSLNFDKNYTQIAPDYTQIAQPIPYILKYTKEKNKDILTVIYSERKTKAKDIFFSKKERQEKEYNFLENSKKENIRKLFENSRLKKDTLESFLENLVIKNFESYRSGLEFFSRLLLDYGSEIVIEAINIIVEEHASGRLEAFNFKYIDNACQRYLKKDILN